MAGRPKRQRRETPAQLAAFEAWYTDDNRDLREIAIIRKIKERTIYDWADRYKWSERAEARDKAARERADREAIKRQADMLKRHAQLGRMLQARGHKRLEQGIDGDVAAINAVSKGIEIERKAEGLPDYVIDILSATDEQLLSKYRQLAGIDDDGGGDSAPPIADSTDAGGTATTGSGAIDYRVAYAAFASGSIENNATPGKGEGVSDGAPVGEIGNG